MKKKRLGLILLLFFLFCFSACGKQEKDSEDASATGGFKEIISGTTEGKSDSQQETEETTEEAPDIREKTTLMIYMTGSDLESGSAAATSDLEEMKASGVDLEQVTLLVYAGGAETWHNDLVTDKNTLLKLTKEGFQKEKDFDLMSMGDPENLNRFLTYAYENYPADRFHLLFWDHGNGPVMGYGKDTLFENDSLSLSELRTALAKSPFGPENKLGIIGFDACLMASVELACVTGDYADYLISSQEVEPNYGWNYAFLEKCGRTTGDWLAKQIVDDYVSYNDAYNAENEFSDNDATLSVIDLSYAGELQSAVDQMFSSAMDDVSGDFNQLIKARVGTRGLGRASTGSEYDLVDLNNLSETMKAKYPEPAERLQNVLSQAVVINQSSLSECCGLSLYYPYYNKKYYSSAWKKEYSELGLFPQYTSYLDRYEEIWLGTDLKELYDGELVPRNGNTDLTYSLQLTDEQMAALASCEYYIVRREGGNLYWPVYASTEVDTQDNKLIARFDGNIIYAKNDFGDDMIPTMKVWDTYDEETDISLMGFLKKYGEEYYDTETMHSTYRLSINEESGEISVKGIYEGVFMLYDSEADISTGKKTQIDMKQYDSYSFWQVSPRYLTRDENGRIIGFWDWEEEFMAIEQEMYVRDGLHFTYEPLYDDGFEYYILFDITDVQDNHTCSELLPIQLAKNEETEAKRQEIEWDTKDSVQTIYDAEGITLDLIAGCKVEDGSLVLQARLTNKNDFPVYARLSNFVINGDVEALNTTLFVDPNSTEYENLGSNTAVKTCRYLGIVPECFEFSLKITRTGTEGYTIHRDLYRIKGIELKGIVLPLMGARAERQTLYDEDGVSVTLEAAGFLDTGEYITPEETEAELKAEFLIENHSKEEKRIRIGNAVINGFYINQESYSETLYPFESTLLPGEMCYKTMGIRRSMIESYGDNNYLRFNDSISPRKRILNIMSLAYYVMVDEKEALLPVTLTEHGTEEDVVVEEKIVYEDDSFKITLQGSGVVEDADHRTQQWYLAMTNKTGHSMVAYTLVSDTQYLETIPIGAGSTVYDCWQLYVDEEDHGDGTFKILMKRRDHPDLEEFTDPFLIEIPYD